MFERKVLRAIFRLVREEKGYQRWNKFELEWDFGDSDVVSIVNLKLEWKMEGQQ